MKETKVAGFLVVCLLTNMLVSVTAMDDGLVGLEKPAWTIGQDRLEPGLMKILESTESDVPVIVHFDGIAREVPGLRVQYAFSSIPAVYALADPGVVLRLSSSEDVRHIERADKPIGFHLDSATVSSRAKEVYDPDFSPPPAVIDQPSPPLYDDQGDVIDGRGVGIAVVDSGIDATHPDLQAPGKVAGNFFVTPAGVQEAGDYNVVGDAHGTHVAGVAAGDGTYAAQTGLADYRGTAPGASLYGFATWAPAIRAFSEPTTVAPAMAFDWILENGADQDPPIRVVVNAWTCTALVCQDIDPDMAHIQLASALAESGVAVVFSAGNEAGRGAENRVSAEARIPTSGIIGIGNHDDEEIGGRDDCTKSSSSRGYALDATTWPDLIAPGDDVWSARAVFLDPDTRVPVLERKAYTRGEGTSLSAGHLGGVLALLFQANSTLSAGEMEYILKATAWKLPTGDDGNCTPYVRADPMHPWDGANFAAGHGLVDAMEAVQLSMDFPGIPDPMDLEPIPESFLSRTSLTDLGGTLYFDDENGLDSQSPVDRPATARLALPGTEFVHTSDPLSQGFTTDGFVMDIWVGSTGETGFASLTPPRILMRVERLPAGDAEPELVGEDEAGLQTTTPPLGPIHREGVVILDDPVEFEPGDRVRATVAFLHRNTPEVQPVIGNFVFYSDGAPTPSRLAFGERTQIPERGTDDDCIVTSTCARIGGDLQTTSIRCESSTFPRYGVIWTGPPGSSATVDCNGTVASCTVEGAPGDPWDTCTAESLNTLFLSGYGTCTYQIPGGAHGGKGYCRAGPMT